LAAAIAEQTRRKNMHASSSAGDLEEVIQQYHAALDAIVRGNPEPLKALYSEAPDVVLANPFGPAVRGSQPASARLQHAASQFSDGDLSGHDRLGTYVTPELATIFEVESGKVSVGGGPVTDWVLRTTTTFRREEGTWKVVHRHADPISTPDPQGPLRTT
jgi:ketosteroid isomerase-like protein